MKTLTAFLCAALLIGAPPAFSGSARYEQNLLRLAEILGAMHLLHQLCESEDDSTWRDQMVALLELEEADEEKEERLTAWFNRGYRKYQDWFTSCTEGATVSIDQFTQEGTHLTTWLSKNRR